jgi:hypothetical protein
VDLGAFTELTYQEEVGPKRASNSGAAPEHRHGHVSTIGVGRDRDLLELRLFHPDVVIADPLPPEVLGPIGVLVVDDEQREVSPRHRRRYSGGARDGGPQDRRPLVPGLSRQGLHPLEKRLARFGRTAGGARRLGAGSQVEGQVGDGRRLRWGRWWRSLRELSISPYMKACRD